jgi:hypothetical protein
MEGGDGRGFFQELLIRLDRNFENPTQNSLLSDRDSNEQPHNTENCLFFLQMKSGLQPHRSPPLV